MQNKKGNVAVIAIIIIVVAIIAGALGWMFAKRTNDSQLTTDNKHEVLDRSDQKFLLQAQPKDETEGWQTYTNTQYGFSFKYPNDLVVDDQSSHGGAGIYFHKGDNNGPMMISLYLSDKVQWSLQDREKLNKSTTGEQVIVEYKNVNGISCLDTIFSGGTQSPAAEEIYFVKNNKTYAITFAISPTVPNVSDSKDKILSTFKFTN